MISASGGAAWAAAAPAVVSANLSPFATPGCTGLDDQPGSLNYLNSEVELQVAVDPTDARHLVGAQQQDRWSDGGAQSGPGEGLS